MTTITPYPKFPAGMTILQAMSLGLLPAQVQVLNAGTGRPSATVQKLLSSGALSTSDLASSLTFSMPYANYGGH